jgi:hypothetical protein
MRCDENGKVCWCEQCGQIFSPYWGSRTSKALHRSGNPTHKVVVVDAGVMLAKLFPEKFGPSWIEVDERIGIKVTHPAVEVHLPFGAETDGEG